MDIYKFKTLAMDLDTHFKIPFELSEDSFNHWLLTLESNQASEQTYQVLLAIQAINQETNLSRQEKSLLLECIYKSMIVFLAPLGKPILNSHLPLSEGDESNLQHIVSIYAELANGFSSCIRKVSDLASAQTLFYGLQSLICAYLHIAQVYQQVYPNFWKQSYRFYGLASKLEIQDLNIEQHDFHSNTINRTFKHLLALYHCNLEQFRPRDMLIVSDCVEKHTSLMLLGKKFAVEKTSLYSGFDLKVDKPPCDLTRLKQSPKSAIRFFSAYTAALEINKNATHEAPGTGVIKSINREHILQAAKTLSLSQKRKFTRFNEQSERCGMIGFSRIIKELHKASPLEPNPENNKIIDQIDPRVAGGWAVPNIELVTEGYEAIDAMKRSHQQNGLLREEQSRLNQAKKNSLSKDIWAKTDTKPQDEASCKADEFYIVDSSIKGYRVIIDTDITQSKVQVGDIIAINNNNIMEIGIICRLLQLTGHKLQLGIKLLALESEISYISLPNHDSIYAWAIFLPGIKALDSSDSLLFNDSKFQCGEFVNLHRHDKEPSSCRLNKLLHLNFAAMHIELFNSSVME
ncbi:MAG: hypothetical protein DRQ62_04565 [Gammaproteobacteria bacterium]|nr:MAG: hypothetical protein DRQ62_04565 [Gammaproteobacteria bacterium]